MSFNNFPPPQQPSSSSLPLTSRFTPAQIAEFRRRQALAAARPQGVQYPGASSQPSGTLLSSATISAGRPASPPRPSNTYRAALPPGQIPFNTYSQGGTISTSNYSTNTGNNHNLAYRPSAIPNRLNEVNNTYRPQYTSSRDDYDSGYDRRRNDGMRGSMRAEIGKLMYAAGDVQDPDGDSLDYMEDLVVDFLSDLCRPVPPIKTATSTVLPPLTVPILRRRLSHPIMSKYLSRFDHMVYMNKELQASRNVGMPSNQDLINIAGKEFLGLNEESVEKVKKKVGRPKRVVDPAVGEEGKGGKDDSNKEKKRPGPKPGWKRRLVEGSEPPRKKSFIKRERTANP